MKASTTGEVFDAYGLNGLVNLIVSPVYDDDSRPLGVTLSPDEARLLGLKLIRAADTAESKESE